MDWLFHPAALALVTWVGGVVGVLGTLAGLTGLWLTYGQARGARSAADEASQAAKAAVASLGANLNIASISHSYSQVIVVKDHVQRGNIGNSIFIFHNLKRDLLHVCAFFDGMKDLEDEVKVIRRNINIVEKELDELDAGGGKDHQRRVYRALSGISEFLAKQEYRGKITVPAPNEGAA